MIFAETLLAGDQWLKDVRLKIENGVIASIEAGSAAQADDQRVSVLLPALSNLHSHAFQRAMAGMSEVKAAGRESFWSWRQIMYRFLDHLTPDHVQAIAALVYMEMLEAGYAAVGEFHYLHHAPGGTPYAALDEMSAQIFAAAKSTGIGLTHLPVLYTYGGVALEPLAGGQRRFGNDLDRFLRLVECCASHIAHSNFDTQLGVAPHSLRATTLDDIRRLTDEHGQCPVHIHIAEQVKEVADVEAKTGQRPVDYLMSNINVASNWCLIHATHMSAAETRALAQSGAVAGLCPITESNLGDGIFDGVSYIQQAGRFGVGSDSNVRISLTEELRTLEYSQRLRDQARTLMVSPEGSVGQSLYLGAAAGGAQALGRNAGEIKIRALADLVAIDRSHPALCALSDDQLLDGLCFAAPDGVVRDVWSAGRHVVCDGQHIARDEIIRHYRSAIAGLLASL